jgi:hypothetical protein
VLPVFGTLSSSINIEDRAVRMIFLATSAVRYDSSHEGSFTVITYMTVFCSHNITLKKRLSFSVSSHVRFNSISLGDLLFVLGLLLNRMVIRSSLFMLNDIKS